MWLKEGNCVRLRHSGVLLYAVCTYVRMDVCMCVCMYVHMYVCMYVCMNVMPTLTSCVMRGSQILETQLQC